MTQQKVVLAGGTGFLGHSLANYFSQAGFKVIVVGRKGLPQPNAWVYKWDAKTLGKWATELNGAAALINLAGRSVNCRYNEANKESIMQSRIATTALLGQAVAACDQPPPVWLNASTATIYKHTYGPAHTESGEIGPHPEAKDAFSVQVAQAWEEALDKAYTPNTRKVALRIAIVLGREPGGALEELVKLVKRGLGGTMGHGRQYFSWVHAEDFCRALHFIMEGNGQGVYNISAPNPVTNKEVMRLLRKQLSMPVGLPTPKWMLELGAMVMGTETELIIKSRHVVPQRLLDEGFRFSYPELSTTLNNLVY